MAVDNFIYQGINRAISDYTGSRMCEELINLRPTEGGVVPVKDFTVIMDNVPYDKVFVHHTTSGPKYIVVRHSYGSVSVILMKVVSGEYVTDTTLFSVTGLGNDAAIQDVLDHLYFAAAGNIILFSICAETAGKYENHAFTWKMDESLDPPAMGYVPMEAGVPNVSFQVKDNNTASGATSNLFRIWQNIAHLTEQSSLSECVDAVSSGLNAIQEENPDLCLGPIIIAIAFKTNDGSTFWTSKWQVYDPIPTVIADPETPYTDENEASEFFARFFDKYHFGYLAGMTHGDVLADIFACGTKVRLEFDQLAPGSWNKDTSIIQSIEVYCSRPKLYLDVDGAKDGLFELSPEHPSDDDYQLFLPQTKYEDMELDGQLLYHQASIQMTTLADSPQTINLTFGGNIQITEDTLDTDAGAVKRYGEILSYNARFHYWNSVSHIDVGVPTFNFSESNPSGLTHIFVRYADDDQSELVWVEKNNSKRYGDAYFVIAPSLNIKEVITYSKTTGYYWVRKYRMTESSSYNYTICVGGPYYTSGQQSGTASEYEALIPSSGNPTGINNVERDAINVTEQYNPFVFRVEHSYKAPGNVIDVQPQMAGLTDVSYGRDPLNVFTEMGLYNLTLGSANVLYGAFLPVSNLVGQRGGIPTEMGTFFLGDGSLWLVAGRRVTLISDALSQGPHKYIRSDAGYKKIAGVDETFAPTPSGQTPPTPIYDVSPYLSRVDFDTFSKGGRLAYNRFRMELFVSNPAYGYSYVLSLKYRQWFKLSRQVWQDEPGSTIARAPVNYLASTNSYIYDLSTESNSSSILAHLQSRPFSMGFQYSHIHRIVSMIRAKLSGTAGDKIVVGLYGSDDLQNWRLLAYAKRTGSTTTSTVNEQTVTNDVPLFLSQVRTSSSARSWRYYTVCIGGQIQAGGDFPTDIGPVLVDYEPVIRRIG